MIFGLFKKKPDKTKAALELIPNVLLVQISLGGVGASGAAADAVASDKWALGYIFGFHDGVLQSLKFIDQTESLAVMAVSYHKIFDNLETGAKLFRQSLDLQNDQLFMTGVFAGGQEAVGYLRDEKSPLGLASHLRKEGK